MKQIVILAAIIFLGCGVFTLFFHRYNARLAIDKRFPYHIFYSFRNYAIGDTLFLEYDVKASKQSYHTGGWYIIFEKQ